MKKIISINILLIFILPMYITFTKFGNIEFGEFYSAATIMFTVVALFYSAIEIIPSMDKDKWKRLYY